ncbi:MAG: sulfotransferase [Methylococcaceae bacterium]
MSLIKKTGKRLITGSGVIGKSLRRCLGHYESVVGPVYAQRRHKSSMERGCSITHGLELIKQRWPEVQSSELASPVFILSAGWRSGSTMMQRLIMSRQSILVWGEPYSHARIISHLADGISAITESWPDEDWFIDSYDLKEISSTFVANMYPPVQDMQEACLAYMKTLLKEPARQRGFQRWGLKDVRLTIEDAHFIKWLFPNAKFVFLCRNPYNAYKSYSTDRSWYREWPNSPVFTATQFGRHWNSLATGFYEGAEKVGGIFLRYEDVLNGAVDLSTIETYLDLKIDPSLLNKKVGSHSKEKNNLSLIELKQLKKEVGAMAILLGYKP